MKRISIFMLLLSLMGMTSWAQDYGEGLIKSADQLYSECSDEAEGQNLGYLLDGDPSTFWHTSRHPGWEEIAPHWIQINLDAPVEGNIIVYMLRRDCHATHPREVRITCASSTDFADETIIAENVEISNPYWGAEGYSTPIHLSAPTQYIRIYVTLCTTSNHTAYYWHAAELQLYKPTDETIARLKLEDVFMKYDMYMYEDFDYGKDYGQVTDRESGDMFREKLAYVNSLLENETYPSEEEIDAIAAELDSLYECVWNSENLFQLEQDGYYRIIANKNYYEERETVDPETGEPIIETVNGIVKSMYANVDGYAGWHTLDRKSGFDLWQLTTNEDNTISMINVATGMGLQNTYDATMTANPNEFITMGFDFAGRDEENNRVILYIRNSTDNRDKTGVKEIYLHQQEHSRGAGKEGRICTWIGTYQNDRINQEYWGTSEWYLEPVSEEEAQAIIGTISTSTYTITFNTKGGEPIDKMVMRPNQTLYIPTPVRDGYIFTGWTACDENGNELESLPEKMPEMNLVLTAKWVTLVKALITSVDQLYSECTESTEGTDLGALLDNDPDTYWHTAWTDNVPPYPHWIQINLSAPVEGDLVVYMLRRATLQNHPVKVMLTCASSSDFTDESIIAEDVEMSNPSSGEEGYSTPVHLSAPVQYVRIYATLCHKEYEEDCVSCWHAAELQLYAVLPGEDALQWRLDYLLSKYAEKFDTGTDYGQYSDTESADRFYECINELKSMSNGSSAATEEAVSALETEMKDLYNKIIASEVLYSLPANGYYRIIANKNYYEERETGDVDPETGEPIIETVNGIVKSMYANVDGYAGWHTLDKKSGFDLWQLTTNEDNTISMINAATGMGLQDTYDATMTANPNEFITMGFDFAGRDEENNRVILYIRNSTDNRDKTGEHGIYLHQQGHRQGAGVEGRICTWFGTYQNDRISPGDWGTSEWYLEPVSEEEAQAIIGTISTYTITFNTKGGEPINEMVMKPNQTLNIPTPVRDGYIFTGWIVCDENGNELESLPEKMPEMNLVLTAKWGTLGKALITSVDQLYSECTESTEGTDLGALLDNDPDTYWHTAWSNNVPPYPHWIQINLSAPVEGDLVVYMLRRVTLEDHPVEIKLTCASNSDFTDETIIAKDVEMSNPSSGEEGYSTPVHLSAPVQYIRIYATLMSRLSGDNPDRCWHAAELQLYSVRAEGEEGGEADEIEALQKELAQYAAVELPEIDPKAEVVDNTEYDFLAVVKAVADAKAALGTTDVATLTEVLAQAKKVVDPYIQNCEKNGPAISCLYTMNEEWGTLILPFGFFAPLDWTLYSCNGLKEDEATLEITEQYYGAKFTPYIIHGVPGARIQFIGHVKGQWYNQVQNGIIVGVLDKPYTPSTGEYVMQKQHDVIGFYRVNTDNSAPVVEPFHCYLSLPNAAAKVIRWEDLTDGIEMVDAEGNESQIIYNLQGQRLLRKQAGVNIVNGKKVLSK